MARPVIVRPFAPSDARDLTRIHLESENASLDEWGAGVHMVVDAEDAARGWFHQPDNARVLVAEIDGAVVGWLHLIVQEGAAEIGGLYVDPAHWRTGIGSALLRAAEDMIERASIPEVILWVMARHARARGFYEARGWEAVPTRTRTVTLENVELPQICYVKRYRSIPGRARVSPP